VVNKVYFIVRKTKKLEGEATIPASKSNSVRAMFCGLLADGTSEAVIRDPCWDAYVMSNVISQFGAKVTVEGNKWLIEGTGGELEAPKDVLNVENSGTGLFITTAVAALVDAYCIITGDEQIRYKPGRWGQPLLDALKQLGAEAAFSARGDGKPPLIVKGVIKGGKTTLPGINSQWLTPLLIATPLAEKDSEIMVKDLHESPYIRMTLEWLDRCKIKVDCDEGLERFFVYGGQSYKSYRYVLPGDWESASYVLVAGAMMEDAEITVYGVDLRDVQGDKAIVKILKDMGADINVRNYGADGIVVRGGSELSGIEIDCKELPDAIPHLAVLGTQAKGKTVLRNVAASRLKETDRVASIKMELEKMGAKIEDRGNEVIIYQSKLHGAWIDGHMDHRIVMASSLAGMVAEGTTVISDAEYVRKSFPTFYEVFKSLGANILRVQ
jgi:3-phosphoshikimate 1-carboxyvinyltransferase